MIGDRRSAILALVIEQYIRTGEPMGSKTLSQLLPYSVSSATIRNEMAYLGELGYLEQRHTSGGRVPSKNSYRFYIDNLMVSEQLTPFEIEKINEILSVNASDPERLLNDACSLLASITHCASFCSTETDSLDCVQGVELIPSGKNKAMLVMLTVGGKIKSSVCKTNCPIDDEFRMLFYKIVNNFFIGTPLTDISVSLLQSMSAFVGVRIFDMLPVLTTLCSLCTEASKSTITIDGETSLLTHDEFEGDIYQILSFLANRDKLSKILKEYSNQVTGTKVFIGDENFIYDLRGATTIISTYKYNDSQKATLGIIGPTRINYKSILPRVEFITRVVNQLLAKGGVSYE